MTGDLPKLSLSVSDKKIKQLIVLLQSIPLPPPSLANRTAVDTTDVHVCSSMIVYGDNVFVIQLYLEVPVPAVTMETSAIVDTVMILPPSAESEDDDSE